MKNSYQGEGPPPKMVEACYHEAKKRHDFFSSNQLDPNN